LILLYFVYFGKRVFSPLLFFAPVLLWEGGGGEGGRQESFLSTFVFRPRPPLGGRGRGEEKEKARVGWSKVSGRGKVAERSGADGIEVEGGSGGGRRKKRQE